MEEITVIQAIFDMDFKYKHMNYVSPVLATYCR